MLNNPPSTAERLAHETAQRRLRLGMAGKTVNVSTPKNTVFDYHMKLYSRYMANRILATQTSKAFEHKPSQDVPRGSISVSYVDRRSIRSICNYALLKHPGISIKELIESSRTSRIVKARHDAVYAVYMNRHDLSSVSIGKWFNLDHSSVLYIIKKMSAKDGDEDAIDYIERRRARYCVNNGEMQ